MTHYRAAGQGYITTYNGLRQLTSRTNIDDEPTSVTDAQNVVTTRTFDYLGRVLTRKQGTLPNEVFTYTARGLTNHTDQLGKLTKYTFDAALRKTAETTPNNETVGSSKEVRPSSGRAGSDWGL